MPKTLCLLLFTFLAGLIRVTAQPSADPARVPNSEVVRVGVLPDGPYSWAQIRTDTTLAFGPADSLRPARARGYWLKLTLCNHRRRAEATELLVLPNLDNTLFFFDEEARAWRTRRAGVAVPTDRQRVKGPLPLWLPARATTTVYVRVRLSPRAALPAAIGLRVQLEPAAVARKTDDFFGTAWAVALAVLGVLLLTNLSAYFRSRDRATLYYICTQVGAVLYVTAFRGYFKVLFPTPVFSLLVLPDGRSYAYTLNNVLMHLSVVLLLTGFVQMTRAYLPTAARLPGLDVALRYALRGYCAFTAVVAAVNVGGFYLNYYTLLLDNLLVLGVILLLLFTTVAAYRQRLPLARTYLLANVLPLLCVAGVAVYHVIFGFDNNGNLLLPDLAIVSHALCFSAALSLRLQNLQRTLLATEQEARALALDIQEHELRHREIVLKNSHIQAALLEMQRRQQARDQHTQALSQDNEQHEATNQELREQLEANQRELASTTLYVTQKNALLAELKQQIRELSAQRPDQQPELAGIQSILQTNLYLDEDWAKFKLHFEQVHPRFFEELQARYPALTKNEQRLYCYFHIHLATKEIAALLNIDPASVRRAKTRLYKKIAAADQAAGRTPPPEPPLSVE
ncbi:7TMR-DISM extracellular 2 [Hymenobacter daecheongensis DSM 21074]|uniref:7TMR-DISM extracellular 2 n=1 Tax=Hymenobacter daecheongensis DSM 21074 TaxID=1121955 RepID=A0A1M6I878_9BACT|nr:7TM diverse intracellular signaling domain-containing protein [Hymenobacter daecheongensis]SHJ30681.1 7TMR-DISM extracellular 2 [Hymenobacter daecheongensis DSM 21074]